LNAVSDEQEEDVDMAQNSQNSESQNGSEMSTDEREQYE